MKLFLSIVFLLTIIKSSFCHAMREYEEDFDLNFSLPSKISQNSTLPNNETKLYKDLLTFSLNELSPGIIAHIADYLTYQGQFYLARTSRQQLFLWASTSRVPKPISMTIATPEVIRLNWGEAEWPTTAAQTMVIELTESLKEEEKLERLAVFENLENVLHLHFESQLCEEPVLNINLLFKKGNISKNLSSLQSLVFKGVTPISSEIAPSLQTLRNFIIQGRAIPRERVIPVFCITDIVFLRPYLKNLSFSHSQLKQGTLRGIINCLHDKNHLGSRLVEICDNTFDLKGHKIKEETPWQNAFSFLLKPWVMEENGNARMLYQRDRFVPGPFRMRYVKVHTEEGDQSLTWQHLLTFLSPTYFTAADLIPVMRAWSLEGRFKALTTLIPGSHVDSQSEKGLIFTFPPEMHKSFASFCL